jgi:hypothetical protein
MRLRQVSADFLGAYCQMRMTFLRLISKRKKLSSSARKTVEYAGVILLITAISDPTSS